MKKILAGLFILLMSTSAYARDNIVSVGSSTVFPFSTIAAEKFRQNHGTNVIIESTGTGGGMKMFCAGIGVEHPDMTGASRPMKEKEAANCAANGVTFEEVIIGYDGITVSNSISAERVNFTKEQLFIAVTDTSKKNWSDIDPSLPNYPISIMLPPPTSGTRDAFVELVMHSACKARGMTKKEYKAQCTSVREDGAVIIMGENDNLLVEKLVADDKMFGVFGFSFMDNNRDKVQGSMIEGVAPEFDTIADGSYKVSRPLFVYYKTAHMGIIPGLDKFKEFYKDMASDLDGQLVGAGLIPLQ
jgi:phosphate transport system substrate-binding protein